MLNLPTTPAAHTQACAELFKSGLIEMSDQEEAFSVRYYIWAGVLADVESTGSGLQKLVFSLIVIHTVNIFSGYISVANRRVHFNLDL